MFKVTEADQQKQEEPEKISVIGVHISLWEL